MHRFPLRQSLPALLAAILIGCGGSARAIETWVGTNGEIRVVPGTEDPVPPAPSLQTERHLQSPLQPPLAKAGLAKVVLPVGTAKRKPKVVAKPANLSSGRAEPRTTGAIKPTNPRLIPGTNIPIAPDDPNYPPPPANPNAPGAVDKQTMQPPPIPPRRPYVPTPIQSSVPTTTVDPGNAIIQVDPGNDTVQRTNELDDGLMDPNTDINATPGALPTNPVDSSTLGGTNGPPARLTIGAGATQSQTRSAGNQQQPSGLARLRPTTSLNAPVTPVGPQGPSGVTNSIAQTPQAAITPNPRSGADDPNADTQASAYDQRGIQINSFNWRPAIEASVGANSNIQATPTGSSGFALRLAPELIGQSDWSRHQLGVDIHGSFTDFPQQPSLYRPTISATVNGRVDFSEDTRLALKASYGLDKLPGASALSAAGSTAAGLVQTLSGTAGLTRDIGLFALTLRGEIDRTDEQLNPGATNSAASINNTDLISAIRGTYNLSGGIKPFVELQADARRYDGPALDTATGTTTSHDTTGSAIKAGLTFDYGPILSGEESIGYGFETPTSRSLKTLEAFTIDDNVVWSPTRLTRVTFSTVTAIEPAVLANASGAVSRTTGVKIANDIFRNLTVELGASYLDRHYTGIYRTENLVEQTGSLTWKISPTLQTFVRGTYDRFWSSAHTDGYADATIYAGVRLQK